jgi:hypothetical protein
LAQTNTERINDLVRDVAILGTRVDERSSRFETTDDRQQTAIDALELLVEQLQLRLAAVEGRNVATEERCRNLEKLSDRSWQGWLALIGAGLALLVAFLKN